MSTIVGYGRWLASGSWARKTPRGSRMTWGRLAASWVLTTALVAVMFGLLAAGGFLRAGAVASLWVPAQVAIMVGLVYAARFPAGSAHGTH